MLKVATLRKKEQWESICSMFFPKYFNKGEIDYIVDKSFKHRKKEQGSIDTEK